MGKNKYLKKASLSPTIKTQIIPRDAAKMLPLIFGFKNLDLNKGSFKCKPKDGEGLLYVLKTLGFFSNLVRNQVDSKKNCHEVPEDQIKRFDLSDLVTKSPSGKLHQLGRQKTPQRVVGYYSQAQINLFEVCFLDLKHKLSGS